MTTKGAGALVWEPPVLEIGEKKYPLRRLGLMDIERLSAIVVKASKFVDRKVMSNIESFTAAQAGSFLLEYLPNAFDEILAFLGTVIGMDPGVPEEVVEQKRKKAKGEFKDPNLGTMRDPDVFPLGALPVLIGKLTEHQDVVAFFSGSRALLNLSIVKKLRDGLKERSTKSSTATDGATSTSPADDSQPAATD